MTVLNNFRLPITAAVVLIASTISAQANALSHCGKKEVVYFSCKLKDSQKIVSLCGGRFIDPKTHEADSDLWPSMWLQYRFGKLHDLELVFPIKTKNSISKFKGENIQGQSATVQSVTFKNGGVTYTLGISFSAITGVGFDGVSVEKRDMPMVSLPCDGEPEHSGFWALVKELEPSP